MISIPLLKLLCLMNFFVEVHSGESKIVENCAKIL